LNKSENIESNKNKPDQATNYSVLGEETKKEDIIETNKQNDKLENKEDYLLIQAEAKKSNKHKTKAISVDEETNERDYLNYKYFQKLQKQNFELYSKLFLKLLQSKKIQAVDVRVLKDLKELNFDIENGEDFSGDE